MVLNQLDVHNKKSEFSGDRIVGRRVFTHGQNQGGEWKQGSEVGLAGVVWKCGEKMQTTAIE